MFEVCQRMRLMVAVFCTVTAVTVAAVSEASAFKPMTLPTGISVEVPAQWSVQSPEKSPDFSGADAANKRATLLTGFSVPKGALLRISLRPTSRLTAARLGQLKPDSLAALNDAFFQRMKTGEKEGSPQVISMREPAVVSVSGHPALRLGYLRAGVSDAQENWEVVQLQVPLADRTVHVTMSWRADHDATWRPMMERVAGSLRF